jgi:hypothetical protein
MSPHAAALPAASAPPAPAADSFDPAPPVPPSPSLAPERTAAAEEKEHEVEVAGAQRRSAVPAPKKSS